MNALKVKEVVLQPGRPKIVVPIVGAKPDEIIAECEEIKNLPCDIIEWRADFYLSGKDNLDEQLKEKDIYLEMVKILDDINYIADTVPVIFTLRRAEQGGEVQITKAQYDNIWSLVAQSGLTDMIDLELLDADGNLDEKSLAQQINEIHSHGCKVIVSYHDFNDMPRPAEIVNLVKTMKRTGADIYKVAAMAHSREDAEGLLKATSFLNKNGIGPLIMIGMGDGGKSTRIAAGRYGSCMTFAAGKHQSAPGQADANKLKKWLDSYYKENA